MFKPALLPLMLTPIILAAACNRVRQPDEYGSSYDACILSNATRAGNEESRATATSICERHFLRQPTDFERMSVSASARIVRALVKPDQPQDNLSRLMSDSLGADGDHLELTISSRASDAIIKRVQARATFFDRPSNASGAKVLNSLAWQLDTDIEPSSSDIVSASFADGKAPSEFVKVLVSAVKVLPHSGKVETNQLRSE